MVLRRRIRTRRFPLLFNCENEQTPWNLERCNQKMCRRDIIALAVSNANIFTTVRHYTYQSLPILVQERQKKLLHFQHDVPVVDGEVVSKGEHRRFQARNKPGGTDLPQLGGRVDGGARGGTGIPRRHGGRHRRRRGRIPQRRVSCWRCRCRGRRHPDPTRLLLILLLHWLLLGCLRHPLVRLRCLLLLGLLLLLLAVRAILLLLLLLPTGIESTSPTSTSCSTRVVVVRHGRSSAAMLVSIAPYSVRVAANGQSRVLAPQQSARQRCRPVAGSAAMAEFSPHPYSNSKCSMRLPYTLTTCKIKLNTIYDYFDTKRSSSIAAHRRRRQQRKAASKTIL